MAVVLGLDISLTGTGMASSEGWCRVLGAKGITTMSIVAKTWAIDGLATQIALQIGKPNLVVVEQWMITRSAGGVFERANLQHEVIKHCVIEGIPVLQVTPSKLAMFATGKGVASKGAVIEAVTRRYPDFETSGDDNACDAIVLCAIGKYLLGEPIVDLPATHTRALEGLTIDG